MADPFSNDSGSLESPALSHAAISPSDDNDLPNVTRGIYIGVTGHITVMTKDGTSVQYKNAQQGTILPIRAKRVYATGTTATDLVAMW